MSLIHPKNKTYSEKKISRTLRKKIIHKGLSYQNTNSFHITNKQQKNITHSCIHKQNKIKITKGFEFDKISKNYSMGGVVDDNTCN